MMVCRVIRDINDVYLSRDNPHLEHVYSIGQNQVFWNKEFIQLKIPRIIINIAFVGHGDVLWNNNPYRNRTTGAVIEVIACNLRDKVRDFLGYNAEQRGMWSGSATSSTGSTGRTGTAAESLHRGQMYLIQRQEVTDMMRRYEVDAIAQSHT
jgi:hypothetical protein